MKKIPVLILAFFSCTNQPSVKLNTGLYTGKYQCADCYGINVQLILNGDSSFLLYERYLFAPNGKALPFADKGKWKPKGMNGLELAGTAEPHQYKIINDSTLRMLDGDGKEIQSKHSYDISLTNSLAGKEQLPQRDILSGFYNSTADHGIFQDCYTLNKTRIQAGNNILQKEYEKLVKKTGEQIFCRVIGYYMLQPVKESRMFEKVFVPAIFIEFDAGGKCN